MSRPTFATIDMSAIRHNLDLLMAVRPGSDTIAVVKGDAYGHGATEIASFLNESVPAFGVAFVDEAVQLRAGGITKPILLLEGCFSQEETELAGIQNFWCVVHNIEQLHWVLKSDIKQPLTIWLKVDTGMHRLGFGLNECSGVVEELLRSGNVADVVLMSHLADAEHPGSALTREQLLNLNQLTKKLGLRMSVYNSAGLLNSRLQNCGINRAGLALYGVSPFVNSGQTPNPLKPVMSLTSEIIAVRELSPGKGVGYGHRYRTNRVTKVGTLAVGYADGYPVQAMDGTPVYINGHLAKVIGRVSMDMVTVDLTNIPQASVGTPVELWGRNLAVAEVASHCASIPYSLLAGVTKRVPRRYVTDDGPWG